jgi:hypothetical protein
MSRAGDDAYFPLSKAAKTAQCLGRPFQAATEVDMRKWPLVVVVLVLATSSSWAQNCNMINNVIYCDDGSSGNRVGSSTLWNQTPGSGQADRRLDERDPASRRIGPDRPRERDQYGESPPSSIGNSNYFEDGRVCTRIGNNIFCN